MDILKQNIGQTTLISPTDASINNSLAPKLIWRFVPGSVRYTVQVSTSKDFSTILIEDTIKTDTFKVATGLNFQTMYYWRVQVYDSTSVSEWTTSNVFTTLGAPQIPEVLGPSDGTINTPIPLTLSWRAAGNALSYGLQIASDSGFINLVEFDSMLVDTSKLVSKLFNNLIYYWRVRSQNQGGVSSWTTKKRFTTIVSIPEVPKLVSPATGATGQSLSVPLVWNKDSLASRYILQVATDIAFVNLVLFDSTLTDTSRIINGLANGAGYFWRVMARNICGFSAWSGVYGFTTVNALPLLPQLIAPPETAVNQPIPLTLSWNKATGAAQYNLQIATDSVFSVFSINDSTLTDTFKTTSSLLNNTRYYWRVRAKNQVGVSAWTSLRSFTTFTAALGTPVLQSPSIGSVNQAISTELKWNNVKGATKYQVELSTNNNFSPIIIKDTAITDTFKMLTGLANNTTYYWHVRAQDLSGLSNWTIPWNFTTIMAIPQAPLQLVPSNGATGQQLSSALKWNVSAGAENYAIQVSNDSNFSVIVLQDSVLVDTSKTVSGLSNGTTYYWRVKSKNHAGSSTWSTTRSFTTFAAILSTPTLSEPQNNAVNQSVSPVLSWSTVTDATAYEVQVAAISDFSTVLIDNPALTTNTVSISNLTNSTVYYWRVRARNLGGASNWTVPWSFTTIVTTPGTPVLILPANKSPNQPVTLQLSWNKSVGATTYTVIVATDTGMTNVTYQDSVVTDTTKIITSLKNGTTYYWKVRGKNVSGYGSWSAVNSFTTIVSVPLLPMLVSPVDKASNQPVSLNVEWQASTNALEYHVQLASDTGFINIVKSDTVSTLTYPVSGLKNGTTYYWRVKSENHAGSSTWSTVWSFTTFVEKLASPTHTDPQNNAASQPVSLVLSWSTVTEATTYEVQIATVNDFSTVLIDNSALTTNTVSISNLANNTVYYWRVRAKNLSSVSDWTVPWSFTSIVKTPDTPVLILPADKAPNQPVTLQLAWNKAAGASAYTIIVATDTGMTNVTYQDSAVTDTTKIINNLKNGTTYYWKVRGKNISGYGSWSAVNSFTTIVSAPLSPPLVSPADMASNQPISMMLEWQASANASLYHVQIASDAGFANIVKNDSVSVLSYSVNSLENGTTYYWKVRGKNVSGYGAWSAVNSFTTIVSAPLSPPLVSPADMASNQPISVMLEWQASANASLYHVQIASDAGFATIVKNDSVSVLSYSVSSLENATTYYWKVRGKNVSGYGSWSAVRSFTTIVSIPPSPMLVSPIDMATNQPVSLMLEWQTSANASLYHVQIASDTGFVNIVKNDSVSTLSYSVSSLDSGTTYYWRVQAKNVAGSGTWSNRHSFTTVNLVTCQLPTDLNWTSSGILVDIKPDVSHNMASVKEPTIQKYNGNYLIYCTIFNKTNNMWSMQFIKFSDWSQADMVTPYFMDQTPGFSGYKCAPQLFYFEPQNLWYLIWQQQDPAYSTSTTPDNPQSWSTPKRFYSTAIPNAPTLPINYWIIGDNAYMYLFFTGDNGKVYRSQTTIENFPNGFGSCIIVKSLGTDIIFEGSSHYKVKGTTNTYLHIVEGMGGTGRVYSAWTSEGITGEWNDYKVGTATPFAGKNNVTFPAGVTDWSDDVSHGELLRDNPNQEQILDLCNLQFLYQGMPPGSGGDYELLPYRLGLLTLQK
jgi:hypothetical protein